MEKGFYNIYSLSLNPCYRQDYSDLFVMFSLLFQIKNAGSVSVRHIESNTHFCNIYMCLGLSSSTVSSFAFIHKYGYTHTYTLYIMVMLIIYLPPFNAITHFKGSLIVER